MSIRDLYPWRVALQISPGQRQDLRDWLQINVAQGDAQLFEDVGSGSFGYEMNVYFRHEEDAALLRLRFGK